MRNSLLILVGLIALTNIVTPTVYELAIKEAKLIPVPEQLKTQTNRGHWPVCRLTTLLCAVEQLILNYAKCATTQL